jgi:death-on-curing protein
VNPEFLNTDDVLLIHELQVAAFGGAAGVRDRGLLESAVAQASATFGGEFVHGDIFEMAGAYLFHLVSNHPFVDGNKRTGLVAALTFLDLNGVPPNADTDALYEVTLGVASGALSKAEATASLRRLFEVPASH